MSEHEEELTENLTWRLTLIWRIKEGTKWINDKTFQLQTWISIFCITFVFGVGPGMVLSSDWKLNTFLVEKGVHTMWSMGILHASICMLPHVLLPIYRRVGQ